MSDKTLYVLEKGEWESSIVLGVFGSLESAEARMESLGGAVKNPRNPDPKSTMYSILNKRSEWYRVTAFESCWE